MTLETVGFIELNSIAKGIETADAMVKAAQADLIFAKAGCPGKYYILIAGDVGSVKASIDVGTEIGGRFVVDKLVLPRIHPQVIKAINMSTTPENVDAIGVLEFYSVTASIIGADIAAKTSDVILIDVRLGTGIGGKSYVVLTGDVASVREAVEAGARPSIENGMLLNKVVIPHPRKEVFNSLI